MKSALTLNFQFATQTDAVKDDEYQQLLTSSHDCLGESQWHCCLSGEPQHRSKQVRAPIAPLHSLSD